MNDFRDDNDYFQLAITLAQTFKRVLTCDDFCSSNPVQQSRQIELLEFMEERLVDSYEKHRDANGEEKDAFQQAIGSLCVYPKDKTALQ